MMLPHINIASVIQIKIFAFILKNFVMKLPDAKLLALIYSFGHKTSLARAARASPFWSPFQKNITNATRILLLRPPSLASRLASQGGSFFKLLAQN